MLTLWFWQPVPISRTRKNTRSRTILLANYIFLQKEKQEKIAQRDCFVYVYITEHVGGYRTLIHVHYNEE